MRSEKNKKPIILIVDDVPKNVQVLGNLLKNLDCELAVAMNGKQALDTVARIKPDLILLDVMMPVLDGHEVCRHLKKSEETRDIPVIFLTAKTETEDIVKGFELGAIDYVTKPFIGSELLARVKTNLWLKKTREELKDEVRTKNKFFSIISHDLRGSIGIVLNLSQLLQGSRNSFSEEEFNELIKDIGNTSENTLNLLDNLLEWARAQTGSIKYNPEKLEIKKLVSETLELNSEAALKKNINIIPDIQENNPVFADKNMVLLVLRNLISNAVKFTPQGGKVAITAKENEEFVKILIADTGVGIQPATMEKLFQIDTKISTEGTNNEQGNGLGLLLCKEFIEFNGGNIGIYSESGKGTTAWFTLPKYQNI